MTTYKYNQKLPKEVEQKLDGYIERIKKIDWFKPKNPVKADIDRQINLALDAFGAKATIEYRPLRSKSARDVAQEAAWGAAGEAAREAAREADREADRDAAWEAAQGAAGDAAWEAAWDVARDVAWGTAWDAARGAAGDAAWGAADLLAMQTLDYKYKNGNFINLIPLWEAGLYPFGVIDGKFIVYVPEGGESLLEDEVKSVHEVLIDGVVYVPKEQTNET